MVLNLQAAVQQNRPGTVQEVTKTLAQTQIGK